MKFLFALFLTTLSLNTFAQKKPEFSLTSNQGILITGAAAKTLYDKLDAPSIEQPWGFAGEHWTEKRRPGIICAKNIWDGKNSKEYECSISITKDGVYFQDYSPVYN